MTELHLPSLDLSFGEFAQEAIGKPEPETASEYSNMVAAYVLAIADKIEEFPEPQASQAYARLFGVIDQSVTRVEEINNG